LPYPPTSSREWSQSGIWQISIKGWCSLWRFRLLDLHWSLSSRKLYFGYQLTSMD